MSKDMHNMAITHPKLLQWFTSKNPFFVLLKLIPLIVLFSWLATLSDSSFRVTILFFLLGLVSWSFFEYATHRWFYHMVFKNKSIKWFLEAFHLYHHHNLTDYRVLNAGFLLIYPLALFFWLVVYLITFDLSLASWFGLGTLSYYFFYENVHYFIHYKSYERGYMKFIQKYHLFHHYRKWNKNFGNTITLWDRLLGTYDKGYKQFEISEEMREELFKKI